MIAFTGQLEGIDGTAYNSADFQITSGLVYGFGGAYGGDGLADPATFGVDVVMSCFFAAVIAGQLRQVEMIAPILVANADSVALLDLLPTGWNVVLAALVGGTVGTLYHAK